MERILFLDRVNFLLKILPILLKKIKNPILIFLSVSLCLCVKNEALSAQELEQRASPSTAMIMDQYPQLLFGDVLLFEYDSERGVISLSPASYDLLKLLVNINELNPAVLKTSSLHELNRLLQQPQGDNGGLVRKPGTERWHLQDSANLKHHHDDLYRLFERLGLMSPKAIDYPVSADHCIIFSALVQRMEKRIEETVSYLKQYVEVKEHLYLLGSTRPLLDQEISFLQSRIELLSDDRQEYWKGVFANKETAIESQALECLWECLAPKDIQEGLKNKLVVITSTRVGYSYRQYEGHRPTTESTTEDWTSFYHEGKPQTIFAVIEAPYIRMTNQLRASVLTDSRKATKEVLLNRIAHTRFYFAYPFLGTTPLLSLVLDEIGRNVYHIVDMLDYLESLESK